MPEEARMGREGRGGQGVTADGAPAGKVATMVLHVGGLGWARGKAVVEAVLGRRPGVALVGVNPKAT
jgi:hypothetical protein